MKRLCRYKDALGAPGEGVHAWRLGPGGGFAAADVLLTGAAAALIAQKAPAGARPLAAVAVFVLLLIAGVAAHWLFCVDTALNRALGLAAPRKYGYAIFPAEAPAKK
jgi:hypothetical protein